MPTPIALVPAEEVEKLVARFGPIVRSIGTWDKAGSGSVEVPMTNLNEALREIDDPTLAEAVSQLRSPDEFAGVLEHGSANRLIRSLAAIHMRRFQDRVREFQDAPDVEADALWYGISRELFGA